MTREEARKELIEEFETLKDGISPEDWGNPTEELRKIIEANTMAIEALSAELCEDAISRADAISLFKDDVAAVNELMNLASVTPKQKMGRWIPVSERLPEYDEDIIITHKGAMGQTITSVSYFDADFRTEDGEGYFSDVIAWMPLPEPYKAESESSE